ncbi:MAG: isochorismatase family cysteine hydrolase [Promethearchaeota archaeon]
MKALVIIDMFKGYMKDTDNPKKIIKNQVKLIKEFKKHKYKIIIVKATPKKTAENPVMFRLWGEEFKDEPKSKQLVDDLNKLKYDKTIIKTEYSVFYKTDFEKFCKQNKIDELYFTGVFSGCCVLFSAVDSAYRRIQPILITDATGGPRRSMVNKGWQQDTFKRFKLMIGPLITTNKLIKSLNK